MAVPTKEEIAEMIGFIAKEHGILLQKNDPVLLCAMVLAVADDKKLAQWHDMMTTTSRHAHAHLETSVQHIKTATDAFKDNAPKYGALIRKEIATMKEESERIQKQSIQDAITDVKAGYEKIIATMNTKNTIVIIVAVVALAANLAMIAKLFLG